MATSGLRSVRQQKKAINKRSSDEDQTADVICRCRAGKKTLCQYCKKSPKKLKLIKGKTADNLIDGPEVVVPVVTEEGDSRFASRYWDVNFIEYFSKNFSKVMEFKTKCLCFKIQLFKQNIWAPISTENVVELYNKVGNIQNTIDIQNPRAVEQVDNGDIFIACHTYAGLYLIVDNKAPQEICKGSFSDVYAHRNKVYALEYNKKLIMEYCLNSDTDDVKQRWGVEKEWTLDRASHSDRVIVTGDEDLKLYVSHWYSHQISQYNAQGQCIKQFGSNQKTEDGILCCQWLCGVDRQSNLLVADYNNNVYKILDASTGEWRLTRLKGEQYVFDATLDDEGHMWMSQHNGKEFIITKYEPE